jgi:hypothetical protein
MRRAEAEPMGQKSYQIVGDPLMLAQSAANLTFVTDRGLAAGSTVAQETSPGPCEGTPTTCAAPNARPDSLGMLPTKQRGKPKETSPPRQKTPLIADETFLTDEQLAARWSIAPKTLRNARVEGRLLGFVKIGRSVRYRLSEVIAFEEEHSVRSTSRDAE